MKVSTASGSASGMPTISSPAPMRIASARLTSACPRMKPPSVSQTRPRTTHRCPPARGPTNRRSHGRNRSPSLTNRNASTSASRPVTTSEANVPTPVRTPVAMVVTLSCSRCVTCCSSASNCVAPRLSGGPASQSWIDCRPATAPLASSETPPVMDVARKKTTAASTSNEPTRTTAAASAGGTPRRRIQLAGGLQDGGDQHGQQDRHHDHPQPGDEPPQQGQPEPDQREPQAPAGHEGQAVRDRRAASALLGLRGGHHALTCPGPRSMAPRSSGGSPRRPAVRYPPTRSRSPARGIQHRMPRLHWFEGSVVAYNRRGDRQ